jgi:prepilin-type N-terminal cleavage/methylation domain-containing protein
VIVKPRHPCRSFARKLRAFTLVELLVVVVIIAILGGLAVQRTSSMRDTARFHATAAMFRQFASGFQLYYAENRAFPPDGSPGSLSTPMQSYIRLRDWQRVTPLGSGQWDWNAVNNPPWDVIGFNNVSILETPAPTATWTRFDAMFDDGSLGTGNFRALNTDGRNYCFPVDP